MRPQGEGQSEEGMGEWAWIGGVPCAHVPCTDAHPSWGHGVAPDTNTWVHTPDPASTAQSGVIAMTPDLWDCEGPRGTVSKKALCPPSGQCPHPGLTFLALDSSCVLCLTTCGRQEVVVLGAGGLGVLEAAVAAPQPRPGKAVLLWGRIHR